MSALEIDQKLIAAAAGGRQAEHDIVMEYYAEDVVSVEGQGSDEMPARFEGRDAVLGKHDWWFSNNDVHGTSAEGPFIGNREDQFVIRFALDLTPNGGERLTMNEVGIFTLKDGRIAHEEYLYLMG